MWPLWEHGDLHPMEKVQHKPLRKTWHPGILPWSAAWPGVLTPLPIKQEQTGGRTLAVLGSGLDVIYPGENRRLAEDICQKGTLISEFPLGTQPDRGNFPRRNRIISGLSHATVVAEAGNRSGAILTALNAVDQNRDVFAVSGRINDPQSVGANRLICNGATPVSSGAEIIREINPRLFHPLQPVKKSISIKLMDQAQ